MHKSLLLGNSFFYLLGSKYILLQDITAPSNEVAVTAASGTLEKVPRAEKSNKTYINYYIANSDTYNC